MPRGVLVLPAQQIYNFLKSKARVSVWLYENTSMRLEGVVLGFDEFMNVVLDDADEVHAKTGVTKRLGRVLLKGECITLMHAAPSRAHGDSGDIGGGGGGAGGE